MENQKERIFWGDVHNHCSISYGFGTLENALRLAKEQLDFCAVTGHAMWADIPQREKETEYLIDFHLAGFKKLKSNWQSIRDTVNQSNKDGDFVTFHSYEMHGSHLGDYHLVSPSSNIPLDYADTPELLLQKLQGHKAVMIPHHIAYPPEYRGISWDNFNADISPVVEVCSKHGVGISDRAPYPYYHNMGPRDPRNTVLAGLQKGHKFGFVGSTDHHAGCPGSYGDGKMAVICKEKTRESIFDAILNRRTYAVTGDKINCEFTINGERLGSVLRTSGNRSIRLGVNACYFLDKIVLYKNLKPINIMNGETLQEVNSSGRYKLRVEMGWGNSAVPITWNGDIRLDAGCFTNVETCFRGRSILAPSQELDADEKANNLDNRIISQAEQEVSWVCQTTRNVSTLDPATNALVFEIDGDLSTRIYGSVNNIKVDTTVQALLNSGFAVPEKSYNSQAFKLHTIVPEAQYNALIELEDTAETGSDFYHAEVYQANGSCAFISPIFFC